MEKKRKDLLLRNRPGTAMLECYYDQGGELPVCLTGAYTSETEAKRAIDTYLTKKKRNGTSS